MNSHIFPLQFLRIFEKFISRLAVLLFALCSTVSVLAQSAYTRTGSYNEQAIMRLMVMEGKGNAGLASDIRPYPTASVTAWLDSLNYPVRNRTTKYNIQWLKYENAISPLDHSEADTPEANPKRRLFNNPAKLIVLSNDKAYLAINPGFDFSLGMSREEELPLFVNTRMLELEGNIAGKVGFYSRVEETQLRLARHEQQFFGRWRVLPGAHLVKPYRTRGYDYLTATGYITYSPIKEIMLQFGQDRNIIGNGMRSLLLSDFALDYPFLKIHTRVGKFDYVNLYARLTDSYSRITNPRQYRLLPAKYYAMHYLSVQIKPSWRIGLFEAVMFHDNNLTGKGFDVSYLNPVILYRAIEHQRGDPDKMTVGLNTQYRAAPGCAFYGQFLLNEFRFNDLINRTGSHANKYGWQLGMHLAGDNFIPGFDLQMEINSIRPYTYAHYTVSGTYPVNSYSHYNQPLAHPLGANLHEYLVRLTMQPLPKVQIGLLAQYAFYGADSTDSNWGGNIFLDYRTYERETGNKIGQGVATHLFNMNTWLSYELRHGLFLSTEARLHRLRSQITSRNSTDTYLGLSLRYRLPQKFWHY